MTGRAVALPRTIKKPRREPGLSQRKKQIRTMNTSDQLSADVKAPVIITEQDIQDWLNARIAESGAPASNVDDIKLFARSGGIKDRFWASCYLRAPSYAGVHGYGATASAALQEMIAKIPTPESLAHEKREAAAKLLAEADALVAQAPAVPTPKAA